jgi:hypothetical protein
VILVERGPEPEELRKTRLKELRRLVKIARTKQPDTKDVGDKYRDDTAEALWRAQHYKCAFCEHKIRRGRNDVEHYRPKGAADRTPGSNEKHGYWWLAFTWSNLLFSCPTCNRSYKGTLFPLAKGSVALAFAKHPPGLEIPLLIDASVTNAVEHIEFVFAVMKPAPSPDGRGPAWPTRKHWHPCPRGGSVLGEQTIRVCGLDDSELIELYDDHVNKEVDRVVRDLDGAMARAGDVRRAFDAALRLLQPTKPFVGLSYDALRTLVPVAKLACYGLAWPEPRDVGTSPHRKR